MSLQVIRQQLAPTGVLRAAINMSNFLLVTSKDHQGLPVGVSPSLAKCLADKLSVPVELIPYSGPGLLADDIASWDIGNIANESERAKTICFSPAYCSIEATYLLPPGSSINSMEDVDKEGVRIVAKARSAYDLWLTENIKHATIVRTKTIDDSFKAFKQEGYEVLAGLRPKLLEQSSQLEGSTVMDGSFTTIEQSMGCNKGMEEAKDFIREFVEEAKRDGTVQELIDKFGVTGKLVVASS